MQTVRVSVHVIEVRELPGKDAAGLCDPFVRVTVAGKHRKQTTIRYGYTSTAFDEQFSFPEVQLQKDEYERSTIRIEVFDAKVFFKNELIGQCVFGIPSIRNLPKHEIFQQWVQIEHPQSAGAGQGFVRVSIVVYGENDRPTGHSTNHGSRTLREIQLTSPNNAVGQILGNPTIPEKRRGYNFIIKALRAEHLLTEGNTFLAVRFNGVLGCTPVKARSKNPDWNYQLTMAVFTPRYSDVVEIELWSSGAMSEILIASTSLKFSDIMACTYMPTWFNFYGVPPEETGLAAWWAEMIHKKKIEPTGYLGRALVSMAATLSDNPQPDERLCEPVKGPDTDRYMLWIDILKGCELPIPNYGDVMIEVQFGPSENTVRTEWCKETTETLQIMLTGEEGAAAAAGVGGDVQAPKPMKVVHFTCPAVQRMETDRDEPLGGKASGGGDAAAGGGRFGADGKRTVGISTATPKGSGEPIKYAQFKEIHVVLPKMEPNDPERKTNQLWDIIINVFVRDGFNRVTRIGFVKIKPADVWGFDNDPEWFPVRGFVDTETGFTQSQGFLLVCAKFGPEKLRNKFLDTKIRAQYGKLLKTSMEAYEIRAYIYQARDLPSTDSATGLLSPYVEMNMGGVSARRQYTNPNRETKPENYYRTTIAKNSLNPIWYDTLIIKNIMLPQTDASSHKADGDIEKGNDRSYASGGRKKKYVSLALAPDIELLLKAEGQADYIGRIRFPTELASRKFWPKRARPRWIKFVKHDATSMRVDVSKPNAGARNAPIPKGDFYGGELLVKLEAVPQEYANRKPWYNRHRWPKLKTAKVTLGTVGLRQLIVQGARTGDDDSRLVWDDTAALGKLQFQVPLFPDMRTMVKSALEEHDAAKMKKTASSRTARQGDPVGGGLRIRKDEADNFSDEESLDSDEREDLDDLGGVGVGVRSVMFDPAEGGGLNESDDRIGEKLNDSRMDIDSKQGKIAEKIKLSDQPDFASVELTLQSLGGKGNDKRMYRDLPGEESFSFFKLVTLEVNYPDDGFYAPSMTIRLVNGGKGTWFGGGGGSVPEDVFGSCVIPLRPFSTDETADKLVDQTFLLPKVALSTIGKDQFEAMARRDSDYTNSTIQTPRGKAGANFETDSQGSGGSESTIHSLRFRETSNATILANEDEDQQVDLGDGDALEVPNGWADAAEIPRAITMEKDKLNVNFEVEINSANRKEMMQFLDVSDPKKKSRSFGGGDGDEDGEEEGAEDRAERENQLNDTEKERVLQENKVIRELEEFTGVFWPIGASRKQLAADSVESTLEDDFDAIQPAVFSSFTLKKGSRVNATEEDVGIFKGVLEVVPDSAYGKGDKRENPNQVLDISQAKNLADYKYMSSAESRIAAYLFGAFDQFEKDLGWKPTEMREMSDALMIHRLEDRGPQPIKVRVYVVQGTEFWSRNPDACKPFLQLQMKVPKRAQGTFSGFTSFHDDSFNIKEGTNAFFGAMYEIDARFPDVSQLEIRAYDSSPAFGGPDFIGMTKIDLEDRWFNPKWQVMKGKKKILKEFRPLYLKNSRVPRGTLEMWVEMYEPFEAVNAKVTDIRKPKNEMWELRLVVWETRNVPPPDGLNYISMYVTTELSYRGSDGKWRPEQYQSTDTHWWVDGGVGSFNWRKKFQLEVPCRFPRITFKVWQTDFFTVAPDQVVGTATVDIDFLAAIAHAWESDEPYERPRMIVKLTQDRGTAQRGDLEVQISLVRERIAQTDPVGFARDLPNKDPFLPEPKRKSFWSMFMKSGSCGRILCCLLMILIPIAVLVPVILLL